MNWHDASLAAGRIAGACSQDVPPVQRAKETLAELRTLVPFTGASLATWDGVRHVVVADSGYQDETLADLNGSGYLTDPMWHVTSARAVPTRWRDLPFPADASPLYRDTLRPAGFREGMTAPFFRDDGSYAGMLTLNTDSTAHPSDPAIEVLRLLSRRLTSVVDAFGEDTPADDDGERRIAVSASGTCTPLSSGVPDELLHGLRRAGDPRTPGRFLVWTGRTPWQVRLEPPAAPGLARLARCRPGAVPSGLSHREVEVLTVLTTGASNEEIARALHTSPRTVSTHVEHVLRKLGVRSRTEAAVRALTHGLLVLRD